MPTSKYISTVINKPGKRLLVIACEVFHREACAVAAQSPYLVDFEFLPKSLHDIGEGPMSSRLQTTIDAALAARTPDNQPDAVVLLYGLCNNGIRGLHAPLPLIVARGHDCITLLLGSRARYDEHFGANAGTFYKSPGWIERDSDPDANPASVTSRMGITHDYAKLVEQYGEENAEYLMETMGNWLKNYRRLSFIDTRVGPREEYRETCSAQAAENEWTYEELEGDTTLIERLLTGDWNHPDFLIVQPGQTIAVSNDEGVICAAPQAPANADMPES
ncbi:MAG: DUF1638 domain-containing protein [Propionivibrio sp.]